MDRQTLRDWVHRYNSEGLAGLWDRPHPGETARLTKAAFSTTPAPWLAPEASPSTSFERTASPTSPKPYGTVRSASITSWHIANDLEIPENITLFPIPPYSPELNPVESIWEFLRGKKLAIQVWDDYEAIVRARSDAWNWLMSMPERIRSIASRQWANPVNI